MTDESQEDNIDNDGDWKPATDDVDRMESQAQVIR
jgi:hypothetical protein